MCVKFILRFLEGERWRATVLCAWSSNYKGSISKTWRHYKLCVLVYNCLHGTAPWYLQDVIQPVAEVTSRRRLRSASSTALVVPATCRSALGDRAFAIAVSRAWNSLPQFVTDCSSPLTFKKYLKIYLFSLSFKSTNQTIDCVKRPCSI